MSSPAVNTTAVSSAQDQQTLSFLSLPPELRNQIYRYVLSGQVFEIQEAQYGFPTRCYHWENQLALLKVSRQIYEETKYLLYTWNVFQYYQMVDLITFMRRLSHQHGAYINNLQYAISVNVRTIRNNTWKEWGGENIDFTTGLACHFLLGVDHLHIVLEMNREPTDEQAKIVDWNRRQIESAAASVNDLRWSSIDPTKVTSEQRVYDEYRNWD